MSSIESFQERVRSAVEALVLRDDELQALSGELDLKVGGGTPRELVDRAFEAHKEINLLQALVQRRKGHEELLGCLATWEADANLQELWAERASARDLQDAKAYYTLAEKTLGEGAQDGRREILARLLRKISRVLADHPDNANGECEIYGTVRATEYVGTGAIMAVYRGIQLETGKPVSIQVLKREVAGNQNVVDFLTKAAEQVRSIRHPQIVEVLEIPTPQARPRLRPFFVLQWSGRASLEQIIGSESFSMLERQQVAVRLCQGLAYAHRKGLVHGNLKPAHILVDEGHQVRVADFLGVPGEQADPVWPEVIRKVGTPYYMAPEVSSGQPPTITSDIFSLGRLLFRLFTGKAENLYDVMVPQLYKHELEAHLGGYPGVITILERCTALVPDERPRSIAEVLAELHRFGGLLGIDGDETLSGLRAQGQWPELIDALKQAGAGQAPDRQVAILQDVASIEEDVLDDPLSAMKTWARALAVEPAWMDGRIEHHLDRLAGDLATPAAARTLAEGIAAVLEKGLIGSADERLRLHLKAAQLFHHQVGDLGSATALYHGALLDQPGNTTAFTALDEIYSQGEHWSALVALLTHWLDTLPQGQTRIDLNLRMARIQEQCLADLDAAAESYRRIREIDPRNWDAFAHLERLYRTLERWEELSKLLEEEIAACQDPVEAVDLMYNLANTLESRLDQPDRAVELYRRILDLSPDHPETLNALETLMTIDVEALAAARILEPRYREQENWSKVATALEVLLTDLDPDQDVWFATLTEIASIREAREQNPSAAFNAWAQVHRARPGLADVWNELERLAAACDPPQWAETVALLTRSADDCRELPEADRTLAVSLLLRVGRIEAEELADAPAAIKVYREVLEMDGRRAEALAALEQLYGQTEQWQELVNILEITHQALLDSEKSPEALEQLHRIAGLWEQKLDSPARAIETWGQAIALQPDDSLAVAELERFASQAQHVAMVSAILEPYYRQRDEWEGLLSLWTRRLKLDSTLKAAERAGLNLGMARIAEDKQGNHERAFEFFLEAARSDPMREDIQAELERETEVTAGWPRLVEFYDGLLATGAIADRDRQRELFFKLAGWYRDRSGNLAQAERCFKDVLELSSDHRPALEALDDLYGQQEQYEKLHQVLARRVELARDDEERKALLFRMARIADRQLSQPSMAIAAYSQVIGLDGADREALDGLAAIYERQGDSANLLATLKRRVATEADPQGQVTLLTRIGDLARLELNDPGTAQSAYEKALSLGPDAPRDIMVSLAAIYLDAGNLTAWFALLPEYLTRVTDDEEWVQLHLKAAGLAVRPDAPPGASPTVHFEAVLEVAPYHPDVLAALDRSYSEQGRWRDLLDIYRRQFIRLHLKAADLAQQMLGDLDLGVFHLEEARRLDPGRIEILDRLVQIREEQGDWGQVVALVNAKLELMGDDLPTQRVLLTSLARALEKQGETAGAIDCLVRLTTLCPSDANALIQLARLAMVTDRYEAVVPPALKMIQSSEQASEMTGFVKGFVYYEKLLSNLAAQKLDVALKAMERMLRIEGLPVELALDLIVPTFEHFEAGSALATALQGHLDEADQPAESRRAYFLASAGLDERLGQPEAAFDLLGHLIDEQPGEVQARERFLGLGVELDRLPQAIDHLEAILGRGIDDPELAIDLSLRLASLFDVGDAGQEELQRAIGHHRRVLALAPGHSQTLVALERLYRQCGEWDELRAILTERVARAVTTTHKAELTVELTRLLLSAFSETQRAAELCIQVLSSGISREEQARREALGILEAISEEALKSDPPLFLQVAGVLRQEYARARDRAKLLALMEHRLQLMSGDSFTRQRFDLLVEMSRIAREYADNDAAFRYTLMALKEDANHPDLFRILEELAGSLARWQQLVAFQNGCLERSDLPSQAFRLELALKNAQWLYQHLNRREDALASYKFALNLDESNTTALAGLERLYEELGQLEPLYHLLLRRADLAQDPEQRRECLSRAARLAHTQLGQRERAIYCYTTLIDQYGPDGELLGELETLYRAAGQYPELLKVLVMGLDLTRETNAQAVPARLMELGELARVQLGDPQRAIPFYTEALQFPETRAEALEVLLALHEELEEWARLVELLHGQIAVVQSPAEKFALSFKGARLAEEKLGDLDIGIALYHVAHQADLDHVEAFEALCRLLGQSGRWLNLLALLRAQMEHRREDVEAQVSLALRIAEIAVDPGKADNAGMAQQYLSYALQIDPDNLKANRLLVQLHVAQGQWNEAVELLNTILENTDEPAQSIEILLERGDVTLEHLNQPDRALTDYQQAFELDRTRPDTVSRLVKLLEGRIDWEGVIGVLETHGNALPQIADKVAVALRIARLVREKRQPNERLFDVLESALSLEPPFPQNVEVVLQLVNAHYALRNLDKVMELTDKGLGYLAGSKDKKAEATLWYYRGLVATAQQRYPDALEAHKACQRLDAHHVLNLIALSQLLSASREWDQAVKTLQLVLLKQSDLDPRQRIDVYYMLGVAFANLHDKHRAEDMFQRVLVLDKNHVPTLRALEAIKNM